MEEATTTLHRRCMADIMAGTTVIAEQAGRTTRTPSGEENSPGAYCVLRKQRLMNEAIARHKLHQPAHGAATPSNHEQEKTPDA